MAAPFPQVGRIRYPDMSRRRADRAMDERPAFVDATRQKSRVLVFWLHDHIQALERAEILCERQSHTGTFACVHRISRLHIVSLGVFYIRVLEFGKPMENKGKTFNNNKLEYTDFSKLNRLRLEDSFCQVRYRNLHRCIPQNCQIPLAYAR